MPIVAFVGAVEVAAEFKDAKIFAAGETAAAGDFMKTRINEVRADINKVFEEARDVIANKVEEGVRLFDPKLPTGLLSDWCQEGIGHILCQKHCDCTAENDLNCCPTGWPVSAPVES